MSELSNIDRPDEAPIPSIDEFKGSKVINLTPGSEWPISFGLKKAKVILANLTYIKAFVDSNGASLD